MSTPQHNASLTSRLGATILPRLRTTEGTVLLTIIAVSAVITMLNPAFLTVGNLFDLLRLLTVQGIFALAVLVVLISGGVDVSFPAIGNVSAFIIAHLFLRTEFDGPAWVFYALAIPVGVIFGLLNGYIVGRFKVPALIVTLGTSSLFYGGALYFLGGAAIFDLPAGTIALSRDSLITVPAASGAGTTSLHPTFLILVFLAIATALWLNFTRSGRQVYAVGGNSAVAERQGVRVLRVQCIVYGFAGGIAAIGGVTYATLYRSANPVSLQGSELAVIAAVVLGGALITGGRGTVTGAMLGVVLIAIVENSLVLVGVPATWQRVAVGIVLIVGTGLPAWRALRARRSATQGEQPDTTPGDIPDITGTPMELEDAITGESARDQQ